MFTPGFKLFFGIAVAGLVGAFVYGLSSGDVTGPDYFGFVDRQAIVGLLSLGWKGNIGSALGYVVLLFMAGTAAFIGGTAVAFRDGDVESVAQLDGRTTIPPAQRPTAPSWWPIAAAVGVGSLLMGLALQNLFWLLGLAILAIVAIEWALTSWADRSTSSSSTNSVLRDRILAPFELPILATVVLGIFAIAISRILLTVDKLSSVAVAGVIALVVFLIALLAAFRPQVGRRTLGAIVAVTALVIIGLGVLTAALGPREFHHIDHGESHEEASTVIDQ